MTLHQFLTDIGAETISARPDSHAPISRLHKRIREEIDESKVGDIKLVQ